MRNVYRIVNALRELFWPKEKEVLPPKLSVRDSQLLLQITVIAAATDDWAAARSFWESLGSPTMDQIDLGFEPDSVRRRWMTNVLYGLECQGLFGFEGRIIAARDAEMLMAAPT